MLAPHALSNPPLVGRDAQVYAAFRNGVDARQQSVADEFGHFLAGAKSAAAAAAPTSPRPTHVHPSTIARSASPAPRPSERTRRRVVLAQIAEATTRCFSALEPPRFFLPKLTAPLALPWAYAGRAAFTCSVAFGCGLAVAVGNALYLPPSALMMLHMGGKELQRFFSDPWMLSAYTGVDDALAEFAGAARVAENDEACKRFQTMQSTLRRQYRVVIGNIADIAAAMGCIVGTVGASILLAGALLPALPPLATLGLGMGLYGLSTTLRIYCMPRIEQWRQRQENATSNQGAELMPVLGGGLNQSFLAMSRRHSAQLAELSYRNTCAKSLRWGFMLAEAALFVGYFGIRNNKAGLLGTSLMGTITAARNINVCVTRIVGVREEFIRDFIAPPIVDHIHRERITVTRNDGEGAADLQDFIADCQTNRPSLWQVRGPNGCGKSTMLRLLKEGLGQKAIYTSAAATFGKDGLPLNVQSTGEAMLARLEEVFESVAEDSEGKCLLLDEPLGPLAPAKRAEVLVTLRRLAANNCVALITHETTDIGGEKSPLPAESATA